VEHNFIAQVKHPRYRLINKIHFFPLSEESLAKTSLTALPSTLVVFFEIVFSLSAIADLFILNWSEESLEKTSLTTPSSTVF
jgi:hypothetical protein